MPRRLPPLNALKAFEAAARHESFTRAAEELCVTQGAVSHQVKGLEADLGLKLFNRERQRLAITEAGRAYLIVVRDAFDRSIRKLGTSMKHPKLRADICEIVLQLCHPDPSLRGVPAGVRGMTPQFACERYVSRFDLLARRAQLGLYDG